jgi:membrane protein YdbS with pleckstrin-like domain
MISPDKPSKAQALSAKPLRDWRKAMSDHVAYGLLVYTGLQIFVTVKALAEGTSTALPYLALIVLVAGIIPVCRWFEKRWAVLSDADAVDPEYAPAFKRDAMALWAVAIGLPFALTLIFKMVLSVF